MIYHIVYTQLFHRQLFLLKSRPFFNETWLHIRVHIFPKFSIIFLFIAWILWYLSMNVPRKHQFFFQLVDLLHLDKILFRWLFELFYSVCVFKCVKCVFTARRVRWNVPNHDCPTISGKRVLQYHCQLAASERRMVLVLIKRSDTLF